MKLFFVVVLLIFFHCVLAFAEENVPVILIKTNGDCNSVSLQSLSIKFVKDTMFCENSDGKYCLTIKDVRSMLFTASSLPPSSSIGERLYNDKDETFYKIYTIDGKLVSGIKVIDLKRLPRGLYIVKSSGVARKVLIR